MVTFRLAGRLSLLFSVVAAAVLHAGPVVHLTANAPAGARRLALAELQFDGGRLRLAAVAEDVALDPALLVLAARTYGSAELSCADPVRLSGSWSLPGARFTIHSDGEVRGDDWSVRAPGAHLRLEGRDVVMDGASRIDLSQSNGDGGDVMLVAKDAVDVDARAVIDASGAEGRGGRLLLHAADIRSRGELRALGRGRIDVESTRTFAFTSRADTGGGVVRLDPTNMIIGNFGGTNTGVTIAGGDASPSAGTGQLDAANLATLLATNDVIVHTTSAAGPGTGLQAPITGDPTDGDISVEAEVVWTSAHHLWLLAHDDLIVLRSVQNGGAGSVVGIAGWDGATMTGLDAAVVPASVYGNGTGDAFILGSGTTLFAPGTSFGSRMETTSVRARNISVLGSSSGVLSDSHAMVGYRIVVASDSAAGAIHVTGKGTLTLQGGQVMDRFRFAQIGHGGPVDIAQGVGVNQGDLSGAIDVSAGGAISLLSGISLGYCQIGHGGDLRQGATRGTSSGDITVGGASLVLDTAGGSQSASYAMIGHGGPTRFGKSQQGALSGNITVAVAGNLTLDVTHQFGLGDVMIGHGGVVNTTADSGNAALQPATLGAQSGAIHVTAGGSLSLLGGMRSGASQIGHGGVIYGPSLTGAATGDILVEVTGDTRIEGGSNASARFLTTAQIGHGGAMNGNTSGKTATRGALSGSLTVTSGGNLQILAGSNTASSAQIGHGGAVLGFPGAATLTSADGALTVEANNISVQGGAGVLGYAQIGHGGLIYRDGAADVATQGLLSGALSVIAHTNLAVLAGTDSQGADYAQIGHGGQGFDGDGNPGVQAGASGTWSVTVSGETSLVDVPAGANPPNQWWLGHRTSGALTAAPLTLTTGTLDFVSGTGATSATISDAQFWPRFVGDGAGETDNAAGGEVTLRVRGTGSNGQLISQQALTVPAGITHRVQAISSDDVTISAAVTNNGASFVDLVADDANPTSPNLSPTALFTIDSGATITGPVRLFAVAPAQFAPGTYVPPATAFAVWHDQSGSPVTGVNFKITPSADLAVTKSDSPDPVTPGGNLTYSISVTNNGPDAAQGVSLTDTLPAGTTFVSLSSPGGWSCTTPATGAGGTVTCSLATLGAGSAAFTLVVQVDPATAQGTTISNTATASSATSDPSTGNESATTTTTTGAASADLSLTKTDSPDPVAPGTPLTYTITVTNAGPSVASTVAWNDTLPANTTFASLSSPAGWSCTTPAVGATGAISCSNASLAVDNAAFTLVVNVDASTPVGTIITNTAAVTTATADPNTGNDSGTATTTVTTASANLSITKTDNVDPVTPGSNLTYTITLTNGGPASASSVHVADALPANTTFVSLASPGGWSCTTPAVGANGAIACDQALMVPGTAIFTIVVRVASTTAPTTTLSNTATVTSTTSDPSTGDESATATTTVGDGSADLSVSKTDSPDPITPDHDLTYTIEVTNAGPSAASSVSLSDPLPAGTTFVSLSAPGGWSCTTPAVGANGAVSCTRASFDVGTASFTLVAHVGAAVTAGTVLSNTATVSSSTADPAPANGSATSTTTVAAPDTADLSVSKVDTPDPVTPNANLTYTITVTNHGPGTAASVSLSDPLPAGTTFVSLSAPGGWTASTPAVGANGTVTVSIASMVPGTAVFTLVVHVGGAVTPGTTLTNTASVTSSTVDPSTGDESASATTSVAANGGASLTGTKSASGTFVPGGAVTYTIVLTNNGSLAQADNTGNELTDVLPASLTLLSATATSGTAIATIGTNTVTWNGAIAAGGSVTITIHATIDADASNGTTVSNQGTISFDSDGDNTNDSTGVTDDAAAAGAANPTTFVIGGSAEAAAAIPTAGTYGLLALAALLAMLALQRVH